MTARTVLVTGATGQQGGAVAKALLERGHRVIGLTRKGDSPAAKALLAAGAQIAVGDFADAASLKAATVGADTVYLMGNSWEAGPEVEQQMGLAAVDALAQTKVGHVIYSSVDSANRATGIPHFESKFAVEQRLVASGLNHTISAPAAFFENIVAPWNLDGLRSGVYANALPADRKLKYVAVTDIGAFAASLVERREAVFGRRFDIAGDDVSGKDIVAVLSRLTGRPFRYQEVPLDAVKARSADLGAMQEWFDKVGYAADIAALRRDFPEVGWHTFEAWAETMDLKALGLNQAA